MSISYEPTAQEREDILGSTDEDNRALFDLDLMVVFNKYSIADLDKPLKDPAIAYIHELKKVSREALNDIILFQIKSTVTLLGDTSHHSCKLKSFIDSFTKFADESANSDKILECAWSDISFRRLVATAPPEYRLFFDSICITQAFTRSPNGWVKPCGDRAVIVVDATLKLSLQYVGAFLLVCKYRVVRGDTNLSFDWVSEYLAPAILYFLSDLPASKLPWIVAPSMKSAMLNKAITDYQLDFIIAHEIGHISLGHLDCNTSKQLEFAADQFAMKFCETVSLIESMCGTIRYGFKELSNISVMRMSVYLLFEIFYLIEEAAQILYNNQQNVQTHPSSHARLDAIRAFHRNLDVDTRNSNFADAVFTQWLSELKERKLDIRTLKKWVKDR